MTQIKIDIYDVIDKDGNIVDQVRYPEGGSLYKNAKANREAGVPNTLAKGVDGETEKYTPLFSEDDYKSTTSVSINSDTGKITVKAPQVVLDKLKTTQSGQNIINMLNTAQRAYSNDHDAVLETSDGEHKTIQQLVDELNDRDTGLPALAGSIIMMDKQENGGIIMSDGSISRGDRENYNISDDITLDENYFILRNTIAGGDDVKDTTRQAVSSFLAEADFLRNLDSYDAETGTVEYGDLMENGWNRDKHSDDELKNLRDALLGYFASGDYSDTDELARNIALYEFITGTTPNVAFWRNVGETIGAFIEGGATWFVDLGGYAGAAMVSGVYAPIEELANKAANLVTGKDVDTSSQLKKEFDLTLDYWEEVKEDRDDDRSLLSKSMAAANSIGYAAGRLFSIIAASQAASTIASGVVSGVMGGGSTALEGAATMQELGNMAMRFGDVEAGLSFYASSRSAISSMAIGAKIVVGMSSATTVAEMASVLSAASKIGTAVTSLVFETFAESIVANPNKFYQVVNSKELDDEAKGLLWQDFCGNVAGVVGGLVISKSLIKLGETSVGRAMSHNISKRIYSVETRIGKIKDDVRVRVHGAKDLADYVDTLRKSGKADKADAIAIQKITRDLKKTIADSDSIEIIGKNTDELREALKEADALSLDLQKLNNAIDEMRRRGSGYISEWYSSGKYVDFEAASSQLDEAYEALRLAEKNANLGKELKRGQLVVSQNTTNYIKGSERLAIIDNMLEINGATLASADLKALNAEKELLENMITEYKSIATDSMVAAADEFIRADYRWAAEANNMLMREGLLTEDVVNDLRASGIWGENGELYSPMFRSKYASDKPGQYTANVFSRETVATPYKYTFGAEDDFIDPLAVSRMYMSRYANIKARQNVAKIYTGATGTNSNVILDAAQTTAARIAENGGKHISQAYDEAHDIINGAAKSMRASGSVSDIVSRSEADVALKKGVASMNAATNSYTESLAKGYTAMEYKASYARRASEAMSGGDLQMIWDAGADGASVVDYVKNNYATLPNNTKSLIRETMEERAFLMGDVTMMNDLDNIVSAEAIQKINSIGVKDTPASKRKLLASVFGKDDAELILEDAVSIAEQRGVKATIKNVSSDDILKALGSSREGAAWLGDPSSAARSVFLNNLSTPTAENIDAAFLFSPELEERVQRSIIGNSEAFTSMSEVEDLTKKIRFDDLLGKKAARLVERENQLDELSKVFAKEASEVDDVLEAQIGEYIEHFSQQPITNKNIKMLAEYYGIDDESGRTYLALNSILSSKNKGYLRKKLFEESQAELKELGLTNVNEIDKYARIMTNEYTDRLKDEYNSYREMVNSIAPQLVDQDSMYDEIRKLAAEVSEAKAAKNTVVAINDNMGRVIYVETDPLLADLVNYEAAPMKMSAIDKANYLLAKTFRLGTTGIRVRSMVNQYFKDFGNAFVGGDMTRLTWGQCISEMDDVFGGRVTEWIAESDEELADAIRKYASEVGRAEDDVAYEFIQKTGKALSPEATETAVYKRAGEALSEYKTRATATGSFSEGSKTVYDNVVATINKTEDALGKLNEFREGYLRLSVYQNRFADAVKRGYSYDDAVSFATFAMNNATTNFGRATVHFANLQRTIPYLGAAVNGTKSFFRLLSLDPVGVIGRLGGGIIIPTMYLTAQSLGNEEDKQVWKNLKEYEKNGNIVYVNNGQILTIPLPEELGSIVDFARNIVEGAYDANTHTFWELAANDVLGLSPIDLEGFLDLDKETLLDGTTEDHYIFDNLSAGTRRLVSQLAPVPVRSLIMYLTGKDLYTGRDINTSYIEFDEETGEEKVMSDYSSTLARGIASLFDGTPFDMSAQMAEKLLSSLFGAGTTEYISWLIDLGAATKQSVEENDASILGTMFSTISEDAFTSEVLAPVYIQQYKTKSESAWRSAVSTMYNRRTELLTSDKWRSYETLRRNAKTDEERATAAAVRADLVRDYYSDLKTIVDNLQSKYGADFTAEKYASVLSLATLNIGGADGSESYANDAANALWQDSRRRAVRTLASLGFDSPNDYSAFGYIRTSSAGETYVAYATPMALLDFKNTVYNAGTYNRSNLSGILEASNLNTSGDAYKAMQAKVSAIYDKGALTSADHDEINRIYKEWDAQVMQAIYPYLDSHGVDNVLGNSSVVDELDDVIKVPSDFTKTKQGRYFSSSGLNRQRGYAKGYIEYLYKKIKESQ